jgi:metal-responsive CopG/Arc/MetJ family transcriptional regulator
MLRGKEEKKLRAVPIGISFSLRTLDAMDSTRGPLSRSEFVRQIVEKNLGIHREKKEDHHRNEK